MSTTFHTNCVKNISTAWSQPSFILERDKIFRHFQGWPALPFAVIGFVLTILFIMSVLKAVQEHRVSRKFYALLLNRAFGDALACCAAFVIVVYVETFEHVSGSVVQILNTLFTGSLWAAMVSYISLGLLKLYAIARPLHYRKKVTMKRCVQLIVLSWIAFIFLVSLTMGVTAFVKIPILADWSGCRVETCSHIMYSVRNAITVFVYFFTIICFLITAALIRAARTRASSFVHDRKNRASVRAVTRRFRYPLIKLALNVGTFTVFHLPYTLWALRLVTADGCFYITHVNLMTTLMGFVRISLLTRIILDALIAFYTEKEVRHSLLLIFGLSNAISPSNSSGSRRSTTKSNLSSGDSESVKGTPRANSVVSVVEETFPKTFSKISFVDNRNGGDVEVQVNGSERRRAGSAKEQSFSSILKSGNLKGPQRSETVKSVE